VVYYTIRVFGQTGCAKDSTVKLSKQTCQCLGIAPIVIPESQNVCFGDTLKTLTGYVDAGITVNWYDQNSNLLKANSLTFKPTGAGTFYAEAVVVATGCKSNVKIPSTTAIAALPTFKAITSKGTCSGNNVVSADAKITLVEIQNGTKYDVSLGKKYIGSKTVATASTIPTDGVILKNLANPDSVVYYTIRVFGQTGCTKDSTVKLARQSCIKCDAVPFELSITTSSCNGIRPKNDAILIIKKLANAKRRYDYSVGDSYTGVADYTTAKQIPLDSILVKNLTNPVNFQTYTVRIFEESGCFTDKNITLLSAQCSCSPIPVEVIPASFSICKDEAIPTFHAYAADTSVKINWYDSGGTLLAANTATYTPTKFGVFYVEGQIEKTGCISTVRTPATLFQIGNPTFTVGYKPTTCFGDSARRDGKLVIENLIDGGSFDYNIGDKYTGNASYNALSLIPTDGIIIKNLPNQVQIYTVRIFNKCGFYNDYTVKTNKITCVCSPPKCLPVQMIRKTKR
jgi:hypothetical protein